MGHYSHLSIEEREDSGVPLSMKDISQIAQSSDETNQVFSREIKRNAGLEWRICAIGLGLPRKTDVRRQVARNTYFDDPNSQCIYL